MLAVLPFRVSAKQLVIPVYVLTYDITKKSTDRIYRLKLTNLGGKPTEISCMDPLSEAAVEIKTLKMANGEIEIEMPVTDSPRVIKLLFEH